MTSLLFNMARPFGLVLALGLALAAGPAASAETGISKVPLLSIANTGSVKPNLMIIYDNSGSMAYVVTPDFIDDTSSCRSGATMSAGTRACAVGHPPFNSADFNRQYYDPETLYLPPVLPTGGSYPNITSWTKVANDAYGWDTSPFRNDVGNASTTSLNLETEFPDLQWCYGSGTRISPKVCASKTTNYTYPNATYFNPEPTKGNPYYYSAVVSEYCTKADLVTCRTASAPTSTYSFPAKVRYCTNANLGTCQAKYIQGKYTYPRFGDQSAVAASFVRTDIVPTRTSYPKSARRTDCGTTCTYAQEMTNFANWYTYYRTRNQAMKTAVGLAFNPLDANYNVGVVGLRDAAAINPAEEDKAKLLAQLFAPPKKFTGTDRINFYKDLYKMQVGGGTPLRLALNNVGKMYANQYPFDMLPPVINEPCQQNFTFMTTDGYWNSDLAPGVVNNDNKEDPSRFCTQAKGCVDNRVQTPGSLADVALYWYNGGSNTTSVSLRPDLENFDKAGLVKGPVGDNQRLHMNTYTLGLGVDGLMTYEDNYDTAPIAGGDFSNVVNRVATGCPWNNNGPYVWPDSEPQKTGGADAIQARVDDLWHTAINGRGKYFSAADPQEVITGLRTALSFIDSQLGAASSAATSTPNITLQDNDIFSNTFTTVEWSGELTNKKINVVTGEVGKDPVWSTSTTLGLRVGASTDTRTIKMLDVATKTLKDFTYANLPADDKLWFSNMCSIMEQCTNMADSDRAIVNNGANIVNWLRGQQQYANNTLLRAYGKAKNSAVPVILGDIASSKPAYVRVPTKNYAIPGYSDFVIANTTTATVPGRKAAVYVAANDGMLHAFDGATGAENWAYVPRITMKKLAFQASTAYRVNHQFTTDGSPEVADVQRTINSSLVWRTVLVAGLNGGGRGYYALDVTDPANPQAMWETCADAAVCKGVNNVPDLGLTFGNPQMGTWVDGNGNTQWVVFVTSGYNNVPNADNVAGGSGQGVLLILDINTGAVLARRSTGSGDTTTPSGLARITGISPDPATDPKITYIYGGDLLGQMWRFDLTGRGTPPAPVLMGNAGSLQPITVRPDVTMCKVDTTSNGTVTSANKVVVAFGTGRLLDSPDVVNKDVQSIYVLRDTNVSFTGLWRGATMAARPVVKTSSNAGDVYKVSGTAVDLSTQVGWYTDLNQNPRERVTVDPKIVTGSLNVVTNVPDASGTCTVGGKSNIYQFDVCKGTGDINNVVGGTLSSSSAAVGFIVVALPSGAKKIIATLADGTQVVIPAGDLKDPVSRRAGWRRIRN